MFWLFVQYLWYLLAALALGVLVGWLWWGRRLKRTTTVTQDVRRELLAERARADALATEHDATKRQLVDARSASTAAPDHTPRLGELEGALVAATARADEHASQLASLRAEHDQLATAHAELLGRPSFVLPPIGERVPADGREDELERVEGIGPKMAAALRAAGITTFAQLSNTTEPELHTAVEAAGLPFAPSIPTWAKQAALLARGDDDGFATYTAWLVAGVPPTDGSVDPVRTRFRATDRLMALAAAGSPAATPLRLTTDSGADDLTVVEGIGPKMATALHDAGIHTFAALAASTEDALRAAVKAAGLSFAPSIPTWARQADLLATGDRAAFQAYVDRLVAGREPGTDR